MKLPNDPAMLLSLVNMRLRDTGEDLDEFCKTESVDRKEVMERLAEVNYYYDAAVNQFVQK
ncbi:MAG: DUF4250 domain-containing protein [Lachnospiraceae bacterium]|nr:DUF4250 domain-containing protein [Lachnospiraceae bacterium]